MFQLLRYARSTTALSSLGGTGVDGGQGSASYLWDDHDDHDEYGVSSGVGDDGTPEYSTGNTWVSSRHVWLCTCPTGGVMMM